MSCNNIVKYSLLFRDTSFFLFLRFGRKRGLYLAFAGVDDTNRTQKQYPGYGNADE